MISSFGDHRRGSTVLYNIILSYCKLSYTTVVRPIRIYIYVQHEEFEVQSEWYNNSFNSTSPTSTLQVLLLYRYKLSRM